MSGFLEGLSNASAGTDPGADDARLRGRTYAIPFEQVWSAAHAGVSGGFPRWRLVSADDQAGVLLAEVRTFLSRRTGDARIDVGLDDNGQTRLDMTVVMRGDRGDLGGAARIVGAFVRRLDGSLGAQPHQILDPTRAPSWSS